MDAHHAAEPTASKQPASASSTPHNPVTSTTSNAASSKPDKARVLPSSSSSMNHKAGVPSTTPSKKKDTKDNAPAASSSANSHGHDDDATADNNSEAETIVLAGKDGSPVKSRKIIKREDNSDLDRRSRTPDVAVTKRKAIDIKPESSSLGLSREGSHGINAASAGATTSTKSVDPAKRKRLVDQPQSQSKDSSALSTAPGTPIIHAPRRRSADRRPESDLDSVHAKPAKSSSAKPSKDSKGRDRDRDRDHDSHDRERGREREKDKDSAKAARPGDRVVSHKRKVPRSESDDEADFEAHKARRQRTSASASIDASSSRPLLKDRDLNKLSSTKPVHDHASARHRSISPHPRTHRRSQSTQVASHSSGLSHKKRRIPPPLTTDYHSDASSGSGSPQFRMSTARGLATPATAESMKSASRNPAHKKHTDAHGQTQLSKACSKGELENVKKRLEERPADINYPDHAGNTPLQCAALNGHDKIVDYLLKQGCNKNCENEDKDTPLLDAVENGHLEVVKILLDAGVDPRKPNKYGNEPLELVTDDLDEAEEIRELLKKAKQTAADLRRASTEDPRDEQDAQGSHSADSPHRRSPSFPEPSSSRARSTTSRKVKMAPNHLYKDLTLGTMRDAAGRGDQETVQRVLDCHSKDPKPDPESMLAAAKGGHTLIMELLLAMGKCDPDPPLVRTTADEEHSTPILAAIGQPNVDVIKLLLLQSSFDPTKKYRGEAYYEIARKRAGPNWKEEETILKNAYDEYRKSHRDVSKKSPNRRELESKRPGRTDSKDDSPKAPKRKAGSPSRDGQRKAKTDKDYKGTGSHAQRSDEPASPKRAPSRLRKDDLGMPTIAISDPEASPRAPRSPKRRADPDAAAMSSEGEARPYVRKKLITRKEKIESGRRGSIVSNSSSLRDPSSPSDTRHDEVPSEKYHDRAKSIKEDETRDRPRDKLSASGEHSAKRSRTSATPDHVASEKEGEPVKKRRLEGDSEKRAGKPSASPDRARKSASARDPGSSKHDDKSARKHGDQAEKRAPSKSRKSDSISDPTRREASGKSTSSDKSIHVKAEASDATMRDAESSQGDDSKHSAREEDKKRRADIEAKRKQKEKDKEAEERKLLDEERRRQAEVKKQEEAEKEKKRAQEEQRKQHEDEARKKREAEEAQRKAREELRKRQAEEARILREKEEQERKRKEEKERIRKEKEAADEARRQREQEEREEQERRAREELRQRKLHEEHERKQLDRLPASLRWLKHTTKAKTPDMATRWRILRGVRFDSIRPETAGTSEGREQWVMNSQVAMLLGESDIELTRFAGWDRVPASAPAKLLLWSLAQPRPGLTAKEYWDMGRELPDHYLGKDPEQLGLKERKELENESKAKFLALDLFFVRLSDLLSAIPDFPHLHKVEIVVMYAEVAETLDKHDNMDFPSRWKDDPDADRHMGFCPRSKYYVNGKFVHEGKVDVSSASYTQWADNRVPRDGLTAVPRGDPNYARLAKEQGLEHLLLSDSGLRTPPLTNAAQTSPSRLLTQRTFGDLSPPPSESTATANGDGHHQPRSSTSSTVEQELPLVNGNAVPFTASHGTHTDT